jgi:hypothetical protein
MAHKITLLWQEENGEKSFFPQFLVANFFFKLLKKLRDFLYYIPVG